MFPNGKSSLEKRVRTTSLEIDDVHLNESGRLGLRCSGATRLLVLYGKKIIEAQKEGKANWWALLPLEENEPDGLSAEIEILNSKEMRRVDLVPHLLAQLKKSARPLLEFSGEKFITEIHQKESAYYKSLADKEMTEKGVTSQDWIRSKHKESRGRALKEYTERLQIRAAFQAPYERLSTHFRKITR